MAENLSPVNWPKRRPRAPGVAKLYLGVLLVFLTTYSLTCQRGPAWQDSGVFQWRILHFDLVGWLGLALSHPLLILLGKAFSYVPLGPLAWRMNWVSAVFGSLAVANVAVLVRRLVPARPLAAWFSAGLFGLAHTVWWLSTICESQAILAAFFTAELNVLLSLIRRPRAAIALLLGGLNGLALTAHNLALPATAVYGLVVVGLCLRRRLGWHALALLIASWAVGAAGLLVLVAHEAGSVGLAAAVQSALFGRGWRSHVLAGSFRAVPLGVGYVVCNFPNAGLPLAAAGLGGLRAGSPRALRWAFAGLAAVYLLFAIRYPVPDQFMFFLPFYAMVAVLAGVGFGRVAAGRRSWLASAALGSVLLGPALYAVLPPLVRATGLPLPGRKDLPFRDPARYWLSPWKGAEDSADRFARAVLARVSADGVVIADSTSRYPLLWTQAVRGLRGRPAVLGLAEATKENLPVGTPNVFVVSRARGYYPAWLSERASLAKDSDGSILFRVVWRDARGHRPGSPAGKAGR